MTLTARVARFQERHQVQWARTVLLLPFVGMLLVLALDVVSRPAVTVEPALTAAPALAAVVSRRTWFPLVVGLVTVGAAFLLAAHNGVLHESVHTASVLAVILVALIGWASAVIRVRQELALADARTIAEVAQRVLLRSVPDRVGPVRAAVHYAAAAAHARIGGDLYDVVRTEYGVRAVVGDVRGKGLAAVETAAAVLGAFREAAHQEAALERVASWLARSLARALGEASRQRVEEEFVTLVLVQIRADGTTETATCGHPAPLLLRTGTPVRALEPRWPAPPLGVLSPEQTRPAVDRFRLAPGDRLLLYTDGVVEARDRSGAFYPLTERLPLHAAQAPAEVLRLVHEDVRRHAGRRLDDDAAMLLLQYEPVADGGAPVPRSRPEPERTG